MITVEYINAAVHLSAFVISCLLLLGTVLGGSIKAPVYRWFFALLLLGLGGTLCELAIGVVRESGADSVRVALAVLDGLSYSLVPLQTFAFTMYLYEYLGTKATVSRGFVAISGVLNAISLGILLLVQINGLNGTFDADFIYHKADYFWAPHVLPWLCMLMLAAETLRHSKSLSKREVLALLSYPFIIITSHIIEIAVPDLWISYLSMAVVFFTIYITIQVEQKQRLAQQGLQLEQAHTSIILSQIQPHFLYNALNTIGDLCVTDPEQAQETVFEFSDYLRTNMDSLSSPGLVPFEKELRHVETYLSLERKRFLDRLQVEYDIQARAFHLPQLTVQPIVENAVLHGITVRQEGGKVVIRTRDTGAATEISVADNGVGFDPALSLPGGRSHLGISNVKKRLAAFCSGSLEVDSAPGRGTVVTILIPHRGVQ